MNLLAHNNTSQICYCGQISLQSAAVNCSFSDNLTTLGVTFILLAMVQKTIEYKVTGYEKTYFAEADTDKIAIAVLRCIRIINWACYSN